MGRREEGGTRKGKARQVLVARLLTGGRSVEDWQEPRTRLALWGTFLAAFLHPQGLSSPLQVPRGRSFERSPAL